MRSTQRFEPTGILFGAAYYAEYHTADRTQQDLDLMAAAGFSVIRVGESVWSTWEPEDGRFDLDWLAPVLDGALRRGIKVILGTPTYAVPPWLQTAYPEIAAQAATDRRIPWGSRQEVDFTHPAFRFFAERIVRKIMERYASHEAVIGFQVDNEPGLVLFHNHGVLVRFRRWLAERYGDVETLNREWGLTYWSHRITDWSQLWTPDGNSLPQYDLEWRRFQAGLTTEFISWQADLVRGYADSGQFVTTCLAYPRRAADDRLLAAALDVTAGNPYYPMQDHLDATKTTVAPTEWTTSGVGGFFRQADRMYSSRQERFLVTETDAQSIGGSHLNLPPWPGQLKAAALGLISRGAAMIEYWHWHTLPFGTETYWGGVLPHSLRPGRVYEEIAQIGHLLADAGTALNDFVPDADAAIIWSNDSRWAFEFSPPLSRRGVPEAHSYEVIFDAFHTGIVESGAQARILHAEQALELGAAALATAYPVLVVPALYVVDDRTLDLLSEYASAGGHLILGPRTAYADALARARVALAPDRLAGAAGVHYEEFSNIDAPVRVSARQMEVPEDGAATWWIDGLIADTAEMVAAYQHPRFGTFPAVTTAGHGAGRITVVGTVPSPSFAAALMHWAVPRPLAGGLLDMRPAAVSVTSGRTTGSARVWFVINWSGVEQGVTLRVGVRDVSDSIESAPGTVLTLAPWSSRMLIQELADPHDPSHDPFNEAREVPE